MEIILCSGLLSQFFWIHFLLLILKSPPSIPVVFTVVFPHCYEFLEIFLWVLRISCKQAPRNNESTVRTARSAFPTVTHVLILPSLSWFLYNISLSHPRRLFCFPPSPRHFHPSLLFYYLIFCCAHFSLTFIKDTNECSVKFTFSY